MVWLLILFFQFYEIRLTVSASQLSLPQITNYKELSHPRGRAIGAAVIKPISLTKTPLETLYLETGCVPIRFILKSRRLNFLHYILSDREDSLLSNVFRAQCDNPVKGDWVKKDLEDLEINLSFEEHVNEKAFDYL